MILEKRINSSPEDKILDWSKLKAFADHNLNHTEVMIYLFDRVENIVEKGEKNWLPAFSPFPTMFSIGHLSYGRKNLGLFGKGLIYLVDS